MHSAHLDSFTSDFPGGLDEFSGGCWEGFLTSIKSLDHLAYKIVLLPTIEVWKLNLLSSIALGDVIFHFRPTFLTGLVLELAGEDLIRFFRLPEHEMFPTIEVCCLYRPESVGMFLTEMLHPFPLEIFLGHVRDHLSINRSDLLSPSLIPEF